ncbi:MAG TPA: response regulator [Methylomirabilota bacterium]|nr:response regulator [Methylomirabilota bacterium]
MPDLSAPRVVVIDDDESVRDVTALFLTERGYDVRVASTADDGISLVRKTLPQVVLCDIEMRGIGGTDVVAVLKADIETHKIPVALMSGRLEPDTFALGDAFISKPFSAETITTVVQRLMARRLA